ncbi:MAG TPA: AAA family ATPase [Thermomicrobiales bacterium]|jgi:hypothetical protein
MPATPLLIITGPPASGKTMLARRLDHDLQLPLLSRDAFKEQLFDTLGSGDRERSKELGAASDAILWLALENDLAAGVASVVESNFRGKVPISASSPRSRSRCWYSISRHSARRSKSQRTAAMAHRGQSCRSICATPTTI